MYNHLLRIVSCNFTRCTSYVFQRLTSASLCRHLTSGSVSWMRQCSVLDNQSNGVSTRCISNAKTVDITGHRGAPVSREIRGTRLDDRAVDSFVSTLTEDDRFGSVGRDVSASAGATYPRKKTLYKHQRSPRALISGNKTEGSGRVSNRADDVWTSTFGTLSDEFDDEKNSERTLENNERFSDDEGEDDSADKPYRRLDSEGRRHIPAWYGRRIATLGRSGKIYEAIAVLETDMLKTDRVMPSQYVFTVLIGVLGRVGYTKKAFQVFNQMKKYGLAPQDPTYTALFNACANSPWPETEGLQRANKLRQLMADKDYQPNMMTYRAMIKAYARGRDVQTAFLLVDEASRAGLCVDAQCYSFLLMACVSDERAGLKHAIEVWRVMRRRKVTPNVFHYNLLLRAVRDCGLGDTSFAQELLLNTDSSSRVSFFDVPPFTESHVLRRPIGRLESGSVDETGQTVVAGKNNTSSSRTKSNDKPDVVPDLSSFETSPRSTDGGKDVSSAISQRHSLQLYHGSESIVSKGVSVLDQDIPNILNPRPDLRNTVGMELPKTAHARLSLLGGLPGILSHMARDEAAPDIKTFAQLLDVIQPSITAEADLLSAMTVHGVAPDVDIFNMIIRRRNKRKEHKAARDVLLMISRSGLQPNVRTFGCLAMGCPHKSDGLQLLTDMKNCGLSPSVEIFEILIYQSNVDFSYKLSLLIAMTANHIRPTPKIIERLEVKANQAKMMIVRKERGEAVPDYFRTDYFEWGHKHFMLRYLPWLQSVQLEPEVHPWAPYRQPKPGGTAQTGEDDENTQTYQLKERGGG